MNKKTLTTVVVTVVVTLMVADKLRSFPVLKSIPTL